MPALRSSSIVERVSSALNIPMPSNPSQTSASDSHSLRFRLIPLIVLVSFRVVSAAIVRRADAAQTIAYGITAEIKRDLRDAPNAGREQWSCPRLSLRLLVVDRERHRRIGGARPDGAGPVVACAQRQRIAA